MLGLRAYLIGKSVVFLALTRCNSTRSAVACALCQPDLRPLIGCHRAHATSARLYEAGGTTQRVSQQLRQLQTQSRVHSLQN
jgi:hypothetical protein